MPSSASFDPVCCRRGLRAAVVVCQHRARGRADRGRRLGPTQVDLNRVAPRADARIDRARQRDFHARHRSVRPLRILDGHRLDRILGHGREVAGEAGRHHAPQVHHQRQRVGPRRRVGHRRARSNEERRRVPAHAGRNRHQPGGCRRTGGRHVHAQHDGCHCTRHARQQRRRPAHRSYRMPHHQRCPLIDVIFSPVLRSACGSRVA